MRKIFCAVILVFVLGAVGSWAIDWTLSYEEMFNQLNQASLLNPNNQFSQPAEVKTFILKPVFNQPISKNLAVIGNIDLFIKNNYRNIGGGASTEVGNTIYSLLASASWSEMTRFEIGKNIINFGNSVNDDILDLYSYRDLLTRKEGLWSAALKYYYQTTSLAGYLIPQGKDGAEKIELAYNRYFDGLDMKNLVCLSSQQPFWAVSLSSSWPDHPELIFYLETKAINYETETKINKATTGGLVSYNINSTSNIPGFFSPAILGSSILLLDKVTVRLEYLHNKYALAREDEETAFAALINDPSFPAKFISVYGNNRLSQNYLNFSILGQDLINNIDGFALWKINWADKSSILRTSLFYDWQGMLRLEGYYSLCFGNGTASEYGSYFNSNEKGVRLLYYF